jgi:hypothetical protein
VVHGAGIGLIAIVTATHACEKLLVKVPGSSDAIAFSRRVEAPEDRPTIPPDSLYWPSV